MKAKPTQSTGVTKTTKAAAAPAKKKASKRNAPVAEWPDLTEILAKLPPPNTPKSKWTAGDLLKIKDFGKGGDFKFIEALHRAR